MYLVHILNNSILQCSKICQTVVPAFLTIPNYLSLALTPSPEITAQGENITVWRLQVHLLTIYRYIGLFFR